MKRSFAREWLILLGCLAAGFALMPPILSLLETGQDLLTREKSIASLVRETRPLFHDAAFQALSGERKAVVVQRVLAEKSEIFKNSDYGSQLMIVGQVMRAHEPLVNFALPQNL